MLRIVARGLSGALALAAGIAFITLGSSGRGLGLETWPLGYKCLLTGLLVVGGGLLIVSGFDFGLMILRLEFNESVTYRGAAPHARAELCRVYLADIDVPCPSCGYNLRGSDGERCPECGARPIVSLKTDFGEGGKAVRRAAIGLIAFMVLQSAATLWSGYRLWRESQASFFGRPGLGFVDMLWAAKEVGQALILAWGLIALARLRTASQTRTNTATVRMLVRPVYFCAIYTAAAWVGYMIVMLL